jgi:hypothetical protein
MSGLDARLAACELIADRLREQRIEALSREIEQLGMCERSRMLVAEVKRLVAARPASFVDRLEREKGLA